MTLRNEPSHHRIVAYVRALRQGFERVGPRRCQDSNGPGMVVRFEVDACLHYDAASSIPPSNNSATGRVVTEKKPSPGPPSNPPDVNIIRGKLFQVPQTHLVEMYAHKDSNMKWRHAYRQLFLTQTPHVHHAFHNNGTFTSVEKFAFGQSELADIQRDGQVEFKKLRKLLGDIKSLVFKYRPARISLVCVDKTLSVQRIPEGQSCLPEDALALFVA